MIAKKKEEVEKEKKLKKMDDMINIGETQENKKTESSSNHNSNNIKKENCIININNTYNNKKIERYIQTPMIKHMKTLEKTESKKY